MRRAWAESAARSILSKDALHPSFISFLLGKKLICPRSAESEGKGFFFPRPSPKINALDNWGFYPLALQAQTPASLTRNRVPMCAGQAASEYTRATEAWRLFLLTGEIIHTMNKIKLDTVF